MIELARIPVPLAVLTSLVACTTTPRIQSDYSDDLDLNLYETFDIASRAEIEGPDLAGELQLYFSGAVMQQLRAKGLRRSDDPDILITVSVNIEDISRPPVRSGSICPKYEDYYSRVFHYEDKASWEGRRPMCIYTEGTIAVDLTDAEQNQPIMEAVSRVRLDENDRDGNLLLSVSYDVATMFGESPDRNGHLPASMVRN